MILPLSSPKKPKTDIRRVAILFSGGPAPAADAVIASAATCFSRAGIEVLGILNGYAHLVDYKPDSPLQEGRTYVALCHKALEGSRTGQGIMVGTARANPGKDLKVIEDLENPKATAKLQAVYDALASLEVDALISIGGDDTLTTAAKFQLFQSKLPAEKKRIRVVHLPKTIDNDYEGIDFTFGYFTAVDMLATQLRNLLADAQSTGAYYLAQVMGRKAGWLAYGAAIAGEASLVIGLEDIPGALHVMEEDTLPQDETAAWWEYEEVKHPKTGKTLRRPVIKADKIGELMGSVVDLILARQEQGFTGGVIVVAEGIAEYLPASEIRQCMSEAQFAGLAPDEFGHFPVSQLKFSGRWGDLIAEEYQKRTRRKQKMVGLQFGYEVRCHRPTAFDVALGSQLGVGAYRALAEEGLEGVMVSVTGQLELVYKPFQELIDFKKLRANPRPLKPDEGFHRLARYLQVRIEG